MNFTSFLGMSNDSKICVKVNHSWMLGFLILGFCLCFLLLLWTLEKVDGDKVWYESTNKSNKNLDPSLSSKLDDFIIWFSKLWRGLLQQHTVQKERKKIQTNTKFKQLLKHKISCFLISHYKSIFIYMIGPLNIFFTVQKKNPFFCIQSM